MTIKQIKTSLLSSLLVISAAITIVATGMNGNGTVYAADCPDGQKYHQSDNACWIEEDKGSAVKCTSTRATGCGSGNEYKCQNGGQPVGNKCVQYTRTNAIPTLNNAPLKLSCPSGLTYHTSDNKCWKEEDLGAVKDCTGNTRGGCRSCPNGGSARDGRCIKYTESSENPKLEGETGNSYYDKYCETSNSDFKDACKAGQENSDCTEYANDGERQACEDGTASRLCGVSDGTGTANSADARRECYDEVKKCLNEGSASEQKECIGKVSGVDEDEVKNIPEVSDDGTGKNCGEAETILIQCEGEGVSAIGNVLRIVITVISILIGVAAVGGLAWASVLYAKAEDNEGDTKESKELIRNIVIGLLLYGFMVAIVNWLVPGGIIK